MSSLYYAADRKYNIVKIDELIKNYRNPSAHSEFVSLQMAKDCREIFPERLNYFEKCLMC